MKWINAVATTVKSDIDVKVLRVITDRAIVANEKIAEYANYLVDLQNGGEL